MWRDLGGRGLQREAAATALCYSAEARGAEPMRRFATLMLGISVACGGSAPPEDLRFGLSTAQRQVVYLELAIRQTEIRAEFDQQPTTVTGRSAAMSKRLTEAHADLAARRAITVDQLDLLVQEGLEAGWPRRR